MGISDYAVNDMSFEVPFMEVKVYSSAIIFDLLSNPPNPIFTLTLFLSGCIPS